MAAWDTVVSADPSACGRDGAHERAVVCHTGGRSTGSVSGSTSKAVMESVAPESLHRFETVRTWRPTPPEDHGMGQLVNGTEEVKLGSMSWLDSGSE